MLKWNDLVNENTMAEMVHNFNINAKSSRLLNGLVSRIAINGPVYNGRETIAGYGILPLKEVPVKGQALQSNTVFDDWDLYFKDKEDIVKLEQFPVDLRSFADGEPHFLFIDSNLNYRVGNSMFGRVNEIIMCRFVINTDSTWNHLYICAQRQGATIYDSSDEFFTVEGLEVASPEGLKLSHDEGDVKRAGIDFTDKITPDIYHSYQTSFDAIPIRYVNDQNKVDYTLETQSDVITDKYLNYSDLQTNISKVSENIRMLRAYYFGIETFCRKSSEILHEIVVAGATLQECLDYINAFVMYLEEMIRRYEQILSDVDNYKLSIPNTVKTYMTNGINQANGYINLNFKGLNSITENVIEAIKNAYYLAIPLNEEVNPYPFEQALSDITDELNAVDIPHGLLRDVPKDKFTIQRILWDVYENCFIIQYGDKVFDTLDDVYEAGIDLDYPLPFGRKLYIQLAVIIIKSGITDINADEDTVIIQVREDLSEMIDAEARARITKLNNYLQEQLELIAKQFDVVNNQITLVNQKIDDLLFIKKAWISTDYKTVSVELTRPLKSGEGLQLYGVESGKAISTTMGGSSTLRTLKINSGTIPMAWAVQITG